MKKYFKVNFQFNHQILEETIKKTAATGKGYCCFIDATSLVYSFRNDKFRSILNQSLVNSCDGSYIALLAGKIHKETLKEYIGPDFFRKHIYLPDTHLILGNTVAVYAKVVSKVQQSSTIRSNLNFMSLPYKQVHEFDYQEIAKKINELGPNYIWVSLGAPKQEEFMANLLPLLNKGVMLGVGAALNYFTGEVKDIPNWARKTHLIWLYRIFTEPKKQIKRCVDIISILPVMYVQEKREVKK
jgi:N-acetylglucosaminyldiphosphoundecaprenol N-acetyl-beta-D-mannosaminyltransferase